MEVVATAFGVLILVILGAVFALFIVGMIFVIGFWVLDACKVPTYKDNYPYKQPPPLAIQRPVNGYKESGWRKSTGSSVILAPPKVWHREVTLKEIK